ncbi:MAG: hypothetical protein ACYCSN_11385, partial [Acidobacteriaceae bacterium]
CSVNRTGALVLNPLARRAALTHRTGDLCLDKPFDLIEGHPASQWRKGFSDVRTQAAPGHRPF